MARILVCTIVAVSVFLTGCDEEDTVVVVALEGKPEAAAVVKKWLEEKPEIAESALGDNYIVRIIPPDTEIDHKIQIIRPDPEIDFKIEIYNPYGKELSPELTEKLNDAIRERIERFKKP